MDSRTCVRVHTRHSSRSACVMYDSTEEGTHINTSACNGNEMGIQRDKQCVHGLDGRADRWVDR